MAYCEKRVSHDMIISMSQTWVAGDPVDTCFAATIAKRRQKWGMGPMNSECLTGLREQSMILLLAAISYDMGIGNMIPVFVPRRKNGDRKKIHSG